tara:strand:+ start:136 stop:273 length:138 start_codon:yes stop_codon:yes gene_type:complete
MMGIHPLDSFIRDKIIVLENAKKYRYFLKSNILNILGKDVAMCII